jgi:heme exporter protein CcmD
MKDYSFYIFSAYGFAALVIGALVATITFEYRALKRKLARFDGQEKRS